MKNNIFILIFVFLILCNKSFAERFKFETSGVNILDEGNLIFATEGKAISKENDLEIIAKKFEYNKNLEILKAFNGIAIIKSNNLEIKFGEIILDQKKLTIFAKEKVEIYEKDQNLKIETDEIFYNRNSKKIKSSSKSIINDKFKNIITVNKFEYKIDENVLKIEDGIFLDDDKNRITLDLAYINTFSNKLLGKDVFINLNNKSFNKDNDPRLKGKSVIYENDKLEITKGIFTTCKKTDSCPPWQLAAEKIQHDKKKQIINYKNAWLKVYDVPVVYFPKFFHPDPTVNRKSGFLIPTLKSSNNSSFLNIPYYHVFSDNKDMTLTPRLYGQDKLLLQTEYRQVNKSSDHISDFSFYKEKHEDSKNHFFYEYNREFETLSFEESNLKLKIQKTSNDTYLRLNRLKSPLIQNSDFLRSSLNYDLYSDDLTIESEVSVFEDLNKDLSDRYEFILPRVKISKNIENKTSLDGNFVFNSNNLIRNYQTNIFEKVNTNNLLFSSNSKITNKGFKNDYKFLIKNSNSDSQNSSSFKEGENYYLSSIYQFNSSLPLVKSNKNFRNIIKPKLSLKLSPDNSKNKSNDYVRLDVNNIYNLERLSLDDSVEGGASLTYGNDFSIYDKINLKDIFSLKLANNIRFNENDDLPTNNQIDQKTSNFFTEIMYSPNDILTTKYNSSIKNDLKNNSYENFSTQISLNNFVTTFDYLNENNSSEKNSYWVTSAKYSLDDNNSFLFKTRENKKTNLTEYYNFIYQYKNDCLAASIEYNKDYYDDRDIKPEENILLKLTIIPFGETSSPNLIK
tara:strand:- start:3464 stop:5842 length:2379 start_codon:yes stop_codon:yes gene_type:complete